MLLDTKLPTAVATLRQFARKRPAVERCELCSLELPPIHEHLVEPSNHKLVCACNACAILFDGRSNSKYKRVPRWIQYLNGFQLTESQWENLLLPIEMAFFFQSSPHGRVVALYPSPAGAIESLLPLDTWDEIVRANPVLNRMDADVMALLANRVRTSRGTKQPEYYLVPIDVCYRLVGLIRAHWRGLSGGTEVWKEVETFFAELKSRSGLQSEVAGA